MADGQGLSPLQQFIQQHMETQQFLEQTRAQAAQEALASRQLENQEVLSFFELAQRAQDPTQLGALVNFFGTRNPNLKDALTGMADQIAPTLETQRAGASLRGLTGMTPEQRGSLEQTTAFQNLVGALPGQIAADRALTLLDDETWQTALAISQGRKATAADEQRIRQGWAQLGLDERRLDESIRQFGVDAGLRQAALQLQSRGLDLEAEGLNIQRFQVTQQGELGRLNAMTSGGLLPLVLMGEDSRIIQELRAQAENAATPSERASIEARIADTESSMRRLDEFWRAQFQGKSASDMSLVDLLGASEKAYDDIIAATSPGERQVAIERYNMVQSLLNQAGTSLLQNQRTFFNPFQRESVPVPPSQDPRQRFPGPSDPRQR